MMRTALADGHEKLVSDTVFRKLVSDTVFHTIKPTAQSDRAPL